MKMAAKIFLGSLGGLIVISVLGLLILREVLGAQAKFSYVSPVNSSFRVEIYEHAGFTGDVTFTLFVVDSGIRRYLGDIGTNPNGPWIENLFWSNDGAMIVCKDKDCCVAYVFGDHKVVFWGESPRADILEGLLAKHGGIGSPFFDYKFDVRTEVWRDFVPSEKN
jgi:hypothetical protein